MAKVNLFQDREYGEYQQVLDIIDRNYIFGKYLASIWQVFGKCLASIWQVFGKYLAVIWQELGKYLASIGQEFNIYSKYLANITCIC